VVVAMERVAKVNQPRRLSAAIFACARLGDSRLLFS
jgi:hypothetical protein